MLAFIGLVLVVVVGVGVYRGWFTFAVDSNKNVTIGVNGEKAIKDTKEGGEILGDKIKNGVDNLKKDDTGSPSPATTAGPTGR
jgi:hypothetical protein